VSDDAILGIFLSCSLSLSSCVAPEERDGPELAESSSVNLIRIIISLFSTAVMEHYPRTFPKVRTHLPGVGRRGPAAGWPVRGVDHAAIVKQATNSVIRNMEVRNRIKNPPTQLD
jgi:hypothetical protein